MLQPSGGSGLLGDIIVSFGLVHHCKKCVARNCPSSLSYIYCFVLSTIKAREQNDYVQKYCTLKYLNHQHLRNFQSYNTAVWYKASWYSQAR